MLYKRKKWKERKWSGEENKLKLKILNKKYDKFKSKYFILIGRFLNSLDKNYNP